MSEDICDQLRVCLLCGAMIQHPRLVRTFSFFVKIYQTGHMERSEILDSK